MGQFLREGLAAGATLPEVFEGAMLRLEERYGARMSALVVADTSRGAVRIELTYGVRPEAFRPRYGLGVAGRVAETGLPIVVPTIRHEPMALAELSDPSAWQGEPLSLVCVPVSVHGRCVGALSIYFSCVPTAVGAPKGSGATLEARLELA
ncbi:MAG: GAF domain-containing protein, partial [Polyangiaceae bacterium]